MQILELELGGDLKTRNVMNGERFHKRSMFLNNFDLALAPTKYQHRDTNGNQGACHDAGADASTKPDQSAIES